MSISQNGFNLACYTLQKTAESLKSSSKWKEVKVLESCGTRYLRIRTKLDFTAPEPINGTTYDDQESEVHEEDNEVLRQPCGTKRPSFADYDVVHSPSYQVPVLYITFKDFPSEGVGISTWPTPDEARELLTPAIARSQMQAVGVMGALSMTDHPITGNPAYFIHPCRTAEAMDAVTGGKEAESKDYLLSWFGLVGAGVGLDVPIELAEAMMRPGRRLASDSKLEKG